jgi:hypothetical protein
MSLIAGIRGVQLIWAGVETAGKLLSQSGAAEA